MILETQQRGKIKRRNVQIFPLLVVLFVDKSRAIELRTRSALPSNITLQTHFNTGNIPNSAAFISEGKIVVGLPTSLQVYDSSNGGGGESVNCSGLLKISVAGERIYALRNIDNTKVVKLFSADLQKSSDLFTAPTGVNHISGTEDYLLVANTETKVLSVYDLDGEFQLEVKLPETTNIQTILALKDGTVVVSVGASVSRYRIGGNADPVWTCAGMTNVTAMCQDMASGLVICGESNYPDLRYLSLEGLYRAFLYRASLVGHWLQGYYRTVCIAELSIYHSLVITQDGMWLLLYFNAMQLAKLM